jgi:hypothetical protein
MDIEVKPTRISLAEMEVSRARYHCCIVGTKLDGWIAETYSEREKFLLKPCAEAEVSSYATS